MHLRTSMSDQPETLRRWHAVVTSNDPALLDDLLADEVVFRSPAVFAPQEGKARAYGGSTERRPGLNALSLTNHEPPHRPS